MKTTLREIASETGLSISVLSRVASGNGYVSPDMRERAQAALKQYGYCRTRPRAVSDNHPLSDAILIITGATGNTYHQVIHQFTISARKLSKKVLIMHTDYDSTVEEEDLRYAQKLGVYGVVMLSVVETRGTARLLRESGFPIVMIGRYTAQTQTDTVTQDSYEMGILAAKRLFEAGHTRLGYLGGHAESSITQDKKQGFTDQMNDFGLTLPEKWVSYGALNYQSGREYGQTLLSMPDAPTGLFVSNDLMAMGVADELMQAGCRIPQDLSLICCDKTLASDTFHLALDRFYIDYDETVKTALRLLTQRHENPALPRQLITFDPLHIAGETIGPPRTRRALILP